MFIEEPIDWSNVITHHLSDSSSRSPLIRQLEHRHITPLLPNGRRSEYRFLKSLHNMGAVIMSYLTPYCIASLSSSCAAIFKMIHFS
jgi:hypothetical protein